MRILYGKVGSLLRSLLKFIESFWARVDPILHQSASPNVPPQAHEGMALRNIGPKAFREVFQPSSGLGGYSSPTSPQSLSWFGNNRPKDSRSSLQLLILTTNALKIGLSSRCFWTLSDSIKWSSVVFFCCYSLVFALFLRNRCSVSGLCFGDQHSALWNSGFIGCTGVAPELRVDYWK
jgi:hypothetical protein